MALSEGVLGSVCRMNFLCVMSLECSNAVTSLQLASNMDLGLRVDHAAAEDLKWHITHITSQSCCSRYVYEYISMSTSSSRLPLPGKTTIQD